MQDPHTHTHARTHAIERASQQTKASIPFRIPPAAAKFPAPERREEGGGCDGAGPHKSTPPQPPLQQRRARSRAVLWVPTRPRCALGARQPARLRTRGRRARYLHLQPQPEAPPSAFQSPVPQQQQQQLRARTHTHKRKPAGATAPAQKLRTTIFPGVRWPLFQETPVLSIGSCLACCAWSLGSGWGMGGSGTKLLLRQRLRGLEPSYRRRICAGPVSTSTDSGPSLWKASAVPQKVLYTVPQLMFYKCGKPAPEKVTPTSNLGSGGESSPGSL
ncbi:uncharacterized protein LOC121136757 [Mesocricetus auratus]|uniref:Uncharacterized protein LOC121136757 n=1 Tax=Mesocricetus auratus TaxID=10036 RepID=A0ABM2WSU5_MESAU|nr:uncharacterized protein LOC121136757 [Mesocricetus auratus]